MKYPIFCFGDSFTAGSELVDAEYVENYPDPISFWDWAKKHPNTDRPSLAHLSTQQMTELEAKEKNRSYAGLIGGTNLGVGGTSIQSICRQVVQVLEDTSDKCIITIQPPEIGRWCDFVDGQWVDFLPYGVNKNLDVDYDAYHKFKITHNTDHSNLVRWYSVMFPLISYIENHNNVVKWLLVDSGVFRKIPDMIKNDGISDKAIINLMDKVKDKIVKFPQVEDQDSPYFLPGGHVNQEAHNILAKRLQNLLSNT
jgi:hypothetical protein